MLSLNQITLKKVQFVTAVIFVACSLGMSWAQDTTQQAGDGEQQPGTPAPAFGQAAPAPATDNPPISGLDQPSLELGLTARSFLQPGVHVSDSVDSNLAGATSSSSLGNVTRATVSLFMQKYWNHNETDLNYVGGGSIYSNYSRRNNLVQQMDAIQRFGWRTGQLAIRNSFSYLPEGSFGAGSFGGSGASPGGIGGIGNSGGGSGTTIGGSFGASQFGSLGQQPRITNSSVIDFVNSLSPRSSITFAGGYGFVHFTGDNTAGLVNSRQVSAQAGYDHQINRQDQVALQYAFQDFHFPQVGGSSFTTHTVYGLYGHRVSGRMDLSLAGGPQVTIVNSLFLGPATRVSASVRTALRYHFPKTSVSLNYDRHTTNGSGFFAGSNSDIVRVAVGRPLSRQWNGSFDLGFSHNKRIQPSTSTLPATTFDYLFAGATARRIIGRYWSLFVSYQFNDLSFNSSFCGAGGQCTRGTQRHVGTVGLDWYPHPIRLD